MSCDIRTRLISGNRTYIESEDQDCRLEAAEHGQHPYAIVIACSDSRVIPEQIFSAGIGELFVIRVAGNVLDNHQLGSIEYAAAHLGCKLILLLGHTDCGAVSAALSGHHDGFITYIVEDILKTVGEECDPGQEHPEMPGVTVAGAVYDIRTGEVEWLE